MATIVCYVYLTKVMTGHDAFIDRDDSPIHGELFELHILPHDYDILMET